MGVGNAWAPSALLFMCLGAVFDNALSAHNKSTLPLSQRTRERKAIALLTVPLRGGGLRKCTGAAISLRDVLVDAGCLVDHDETKLVQVQVLSSSALQQEPWSPGKSENDIHPKKVESGGSYGKKHKYPKSSEPLQTRFSKKIIKLGKDSSGAATLALLVLTAPLDKAVWLPVAAEQSTVRGNAPCRLYAWGGTKDIFSEARLGEVEAVAGNWTSCWHRQGNHSGGGGGGAGRRLCAIVVSCLPPATGAALVCGSRGALTGLMAPAPSTATRALTDARALNGGGGKEKCAAGALQLNAVAPLLPHLRAAVPQISSAPSGIRHDVQVLPALSLALPHDRQSNRRRPRSASKKRSLNNIPGSAAKKQGSNKDPGTHKRAMRARRPGKKRGKKAKQ